MITEWTVLAEPAPQLVFTNPCFASDIQILNTLDGVVMVTPDGTKLYRMFVDFDGAVTPEFVNAYSGTFPSTMPPAVPPFPVFGQCAGDVMILSPGAGILFPLGLSTQNPRAFSRLGLDNDGALLVTPVMVNYWMAIPENNIPLAVDNLGNWIFTKDIQFALNSIGVVLPLRGGSTIQRIRLDFDGAILSEDQVLDDETI